MVFFVVGIIKYIFIIVICINLTTEVPAPVSTFAKMSISGSLNHLCENDPNAAEELPSCECLKQFSVQENFIVGDYQGTIDTDLAPVMNIGDVDEHFYNTDKANGTGGVTKISGLKCIDDSGSVTELDTIYTYIIFLEVHVSSTGYSELIKLASQKSGNSSTIGLKFIANMNEDNASILTGVKFSVNETRTIEFEDLGKICINNNLPRSLETFAWTMANKITLNSSESCNVPKDTFYPISSEPLTAVLTVTEPLECGRYEVSMDVHPKELYYEIMIYLEWDLPYSTYCAILE